MVGSSYLSKLENGINTQTSVHVLETICRAFHVRKEWLLSGEGEAFDYTFANQVAERGGIVAFDPMAIDPNTSSAMEIVGMLLSTKPTIGDLLAMRMRAVNTHHWPDMLKREVIRILSDELLAQLNANLAQEDAVFRLRIGEPLTEVGRVALAGRKEIVVGTATQNSDGKFS